MGITPERLESHFVNQGLYDEEMQMDIDLDNRRDRGCFNPSHTSRSHSRLRDFLEGSEEEKNRDPNVSKINNRSSSLSRGFNSFNSFEFDRAQAKQERMRNRLRKVGINSERK